MWSAGRCVSCWTSSSLWWILLARKIRSICWCLSLEWLSCSMSCWPRRNTRLSSKRKYSKSVFGFFVTLCVYNFFTILRDVRCLKWSFSVPMSIRFCYCFAIVTNLCCWHVLTKLVQETCTCVGQSCTSLCRCKFLACSWTQLYSRTETAQHMTRTVQRGWSASCCCAGSCDEIVSNFSCKFPAQVSGTSFLSVCHWH